MNLLDTDDMALLYNDMPVCPSCRKPQSEDDFWHDHGDKAMSEEEWNHECDWCEHVFRVVPHVSIAFTTEEVE